MFRTALLPPQLACHQAYRASVLSWTHRNSSLTPLLLVSRKTSLTPKMADLQVELTAPNGLKYTQPIGLFINNEFVKSKSGEKIISVNPT